MSNVQTSFDLTAALARIRAEGDKAKAAAAATVKAKNADLAVGSRLPTMTVANHTKAEAIGAASKSLILALQSGALVVKGCGKVLKSGDVNIRIGAPLASLEFVVAQAQAKATASREARKVKRFREKNADLCKGLDDAAVLELAEAAAAQVEAAKAAKSNERTQPAGLDAIAALAAKKAA